MVKFAIVVAAAALNVTVLPVQIITLSFIPGVDAAAEPAHETVDHVVVDDQLPLARE